MRGFSFSGKFRDLMIFFRLRKARQPKGIEHDQARYTVKVYNLGGICFFDIKSPPVAISFMKNREIMGWFLHRGYRKECVGGIVRLEKFIFDNNYN